MRTAPPVEFFALAIFSRPTIDPAPPTPTDGSSTPHLMPPQNHHHPHLQRNGSRESGGKVGRPRKHPAPVTAEENSDPQKQAADGMEVDSS